MANWWEVGEVVQPAQAGPKAAPAWGPGAMELPDGSIVRYGPRGGATVLRQSTKAIEGAPLKLTEDQGKAQTQARLMRQGETMYLDALRRGYKPGGIVNSIAAWLEGVPVVDGLSPIIRDDASDIGRAGELMWTDAQLKAVSGAASPEAEVRRNAKAFFPVSGESLTETGPMKRMGREEAYKAATVRSGPAGGGVGRYPQAMSPGAKGSTIDNPYDLSGGQSRKTIPPSAYYIDPQGNVRRNMNDDEGNPVVRRAKPAAPRQQTKTPTGASVSDW